LNLYCSRSSPAPPQTPVGPSAPLFIKELKHQPLRLGSASVFEARVVGVPLLQIEWLKNGEPLNNYRQIFLIIFFLFSFSNFIMLLIITSFIIKDKN